MPDYFWQLLIIIAAAGLAGAAYLRSKRPGARAASGHIATYTRDLTQMAADGKLDPVFGRGEEIERVIHILMRRTKNNPILIGEPGVGKTAIVEGLAKRMVDAEVPEPLKGKRVLSLDLNALISDTKYRGELEKRLQSLTNELERLARQVILFIDEIHLLEQVGRPEGSLGIGDVLKPALARGEILVIGATTWKEYERYILPDQALERRLQPVLVAEPSLEQALQILQHVRKVYEEFHGVKITDEALDAAVRLSDEYIDNRYLPDKAIDLIDEAAAKIAIEVSRQHTVPLGVVHAASKEKKGTVTADDIKTIVDQWVHSSEDPKKHAQHAKPG